MPKVRKEIPELEKLVQTGRKKFVRYLSLIHISDPRDAHESRIPSSA